MSSPSAVVRAQASIAARLPTTTLERLLQHRCCDAQNGGSHAMRPWNVVRTNQYVPRGRRFALVNRKFSIFIFVKRSNARTSDMSHICSMRIVFVPRTVSNETQQRNKNDPRVQECLT